MRHALQAQHALRFASHPLQNHIRAVRRDDLIAAALHAQHRAGDRAKVIAGLVDNAAQIHRAFRRKSGIPQVVVGSECVVLARLPADFRQKRRGESCQREPAVQHPHRRGNRRNGGRVALLSNHQRQASAHAQPGHADEAVLLFHFPEGFLRRVQPILPRTAAHVLQRCRVTGQVDGAHTKALLHKSFRERPHMRRRARKPVHQQHAVFPLPHLVRLTQGRGKVHFRARFHVASSLLHSGNRFLFAHHQQQIARHQHCFCAG